VKPLTARSRWVAYLAADLEKAIRDERHVSGTGRVLGLRALYGTAGVLDEVLTLIEHRQFVAYTATRASAPTAVNA
jgi:hypothetical protein